MSKEADIKVVKIQTCVLKVNIHCDGCKQKVKKLLQKIEGVYSMTIDAEQGKVTVSGNVDPQTLIKKLGKKGKHAELWPSKVGNPQLNKQFQAMQIDIGEGPKGGKPQKGGKDQKGQQQMKGLKDLKLPQFKDMKLPTKGQKTVKFNLPEDDGGGTSDYDDYDDDYYDDDDDYDDDGFADFDMDPGELKAHLKMKAMNQQNPPPKNAKKGGAGGDVQVQNKAMAGNNDAKNGNNGGKKGGGNNGGGQSQGGGAGVAKNGGKNGGAQDHKNGANGGTGNNKDATNGGHNNAASGGKKGGGGGKNDAGLQMPNNMGHGFHDPSGGANVGQMGTVPMTHMGNFPAVQGLPAAPQPMNASRYFQGAGPEFPAGNPYHQQYVAAMMQQQRQNGMYARQPYPVAYTPHPPVGEPYTNYFNDENANGCTIM